MHHTVEDVGIVLGQAIREALGDKRGISRYGDALVPLDEALAQAVVDISGRPYLVHTGEPAGFEYHLIGGHFTGSMVRHIFEAIAFNAALTVHVTVLARPRPAPHRRGRVQGVRARVPPGEGARPARRGHPVDQGRSVTAQPARRACSTTARATCTPRSRRSSAPAPTCELTADRAAALEADGLVVPGVGAFRPSWTRCARVRGDEIIDRRLAGGRPVLGICVGMQVLFERGVERGVDTEGLGEWPGVVTELDAPVLPHMGWNTVDAPTRARVLFGGIEDERFYFVHSFAAQEWLARRDAAVPAAGADLGASTAARSSPPSRTDRCRRRSSTPRSRGMPASGCSRNWIGALG